MKPFTIQVDEEPGRAVVRLEGELDIATTPRAETELRRLEATGVGVIVLDLRSLSFMDSTGLRLLVAADARAREGDRRLAIVRGPGPVHRVLEITGLHSRLNLVGDPDEAPPATGQASPA